MLCGVPASLLLEGPPSASGAAPLAAQRAMHISLRGYYTIAGNMIQVTIKNDGDETIPDISGTVPGKKQATSATTPIAPCQVETSHFACELNLPPRETTTIQVGVNPVVTPADGPVTMYAAAERRTDTQPFVIRLRTESEPVPESCQCAALRVAGKGRVGITNPNQQGRVHLRLTLRWVMACSAGPEQTCAGSFRVRFPSVPKVKFVSPQGDAVQCQAPCGTNGPLSVEGEAKLHVTAGKELYPAARRGKKVVIRLDDFCMQNGKSHEVSRAEIVIAFNDSGLVNTKMSDINANGIPDGKEPKPA